MLILQWNHTLIWNIFIFYINFVLNIIPQRDWKFQGEANVDFLQPFSGRETVFHPAVLTLTGRIPCSSHLRGVGMLFVAMEAEEEREKGVTLLGISRKAREIQITNLLCALQFVSCMFHSAHTLPPHSLISRLIQSKASLCHPSGCTLFFSWRAPPPLLLWWSTVTAWMHLIKDDYAEATGREGSMRSCRGVTPASLPQARRPQPRHPRLTYQHRTQLSISQESFILWDIMKDYWINQQKEKTSLNNHNSSAPTCFGVVPLPNMGYVLTSPDICNIFTLGFTFLSGYFLVSHIPLTYKAINIARNFSYFPNG